MEKKNRLPPWNEFEAALLLEGTVAVLNGQIDSIDFVKTLSSNLKKMAEKRGLYIENSTYRNFSGINFQMYSMQSAYLGYIVNKQPASKLFLKVVDLYRNNREAYNSLLNTAHKMVDYTIDCEKSFLSNKTPDKIETLKKVFLTIQEYGFANGILKNELFKTTDINLVISLFDSIKQSFYQDVPNRQEYLFMLQNLKNYAQFLLNNFTPLKHNIKTYEANLDIKELEKECKEREQDETVVNKSDVKANFNLNNEIKKTFDANSSVIDSNQNKDKSEESELILSYKKILENNFKRGFRFASSLSLRRFKNFLEAETGKQYTDSDDDLIIQRIKSFCFINKDCAYLPEMMLKKDLADKLFLNIEKYFNEYHKPIFYENIYNQYKESIFLDSYIVDSTVLKNYLKYLFKDKYYFFEKYMSLDENANLDVDTEIIECMKQQNKAISYDDLSNLLPNIPLKSIKDNIRKNDSFLMNRRKPAEYFHKSMFKISEDEINNLSEILSEKIKISKYINTDELYEVIKTDYVNVIDDNSQFSKLGVINALKFYFNNRFSFQGKIISSIDHQLSLPKLCEDYAKNHKEFTLQDVKKQCEGVVIDKLLSSSFRISQDSFISRDQVQFHVEEVDKVLSAYCYGEYISLNEISNFGEFPYSGISWNKFVLEDYVDQYSNEYCLFHKQYYEDSCAGAIVKRSSKFKDLNEVLVDVIVNSNINLDKKSALELLYEEGFIATPKYAQIDKLLAQAEMLIQQKGNK